MPAINHKPLFVLQRNDGVLMPDKKGRAGGTYVDPDKPGRQPPRLFHNRTAAKNALTWWAFGRAKVHHDYEDGTSEILGFTEVPSRNAADWEIVPVQLCTMGQDNG